MKEYLDIQKSLCCEIEKATDFILTLVGEFSASFVSDIFGRCRSEKAKSVADFYELNEKLNECSLRFGETSVRFLSLAEKCDSLIDKAFSERRKKDADLAETLSIQLRRQAEVCVEAADVCFSEYLGKIYEILVASDSSDIDVGAVRRESSAFTVKLRGYTAKIIRGE